MKNIERRSFLKALGIGCGITATIALPTAIILFKEATASASTITQHDNTYIHYNSMSRIYYNKVAPISIGILEAITSTPPSFNTIDVTDLREPDGYRHFIKGSRNPEFELQLFAKQNEFEHWQYICGRLEKFSPTNYTISMPNCKMHFEARVATILQIKPCQRFIKYLPNTKWEQVAGLEINLELSFESEIKVMT